MTLSSQVLHFQECGYLPGGGEKGREMRRKGRRRERRGGGEEEKGEGEVREEEGGGGRKREGEGLSNSGTFQASKKKREGNTEFV